MKDSRQNFEHSASVWDHLVGSVKQTGSASFKQKVLKVCDTAFGEPARMLNSERKVVLLQ